jgi:nitroimidazol reductase NimA-like FMN-containing flavoprotein (pyridoxamine 5'-phosphate oxidase superfamily)
MFEAAGLEVLEPQECLRLLGQTSVGRVVFTEQALPAIRPVRYALDDGSIVLRTAPDSKLATAGDGVVVALEADDFDEDAKRGWSVTFVGRTEQVTSPGELAALTDRELPGWSNDSWHVLRIWIEMIEGRRIPEFVS